MKNATLLITLFLLTMPLGCGHSAPSPDATDSSPSEHNHGAGDHDHGANGAGHDHRVAGHAHGIGPHGGTIADWGGGKYHVEVTVDHDKQEVTAFVLGTDEKTPVAVDAQSIELSITDPDMQVTLDASPQEGDPVGQASRFVGSDPKLSVVQEYAGTITGVIDGTPYSGDFQEEASESH